MNRYVKRCINKLVVCLMLNGLALALLGCVNQVIGKENSEQGISLVTVNESIDKDKHINIKDIPIYHGIPYVKINDNIPFFLENDFTTEEYEQYSDLDSLGRCGVAKAVIGYDMMPEDEREKIGGIKPTGWHSVKYDIIKGEYLYNRCHLIAYQLTGQGANEKNLITGTRYLNVKGMLPFENMVVDYIVETKKHVLYRVTPMFEEDNLLASGVLMEAMSVEDKGKGVCFNVFVYNVQPGIDIDYSDGGSRLIVEGGDT